MLVETEESRKQKPKSFFNDKFISCIYNSDLNEEAPNKFSY